MKILFLTIGRFESIESHSIYPDLLRCFRDHGHDVYIVSPNEKRTGRKTEFITQNGAHILRVKTGNVTKGGNLISKAAAQVLLERQFIYGAKRPI